MSYEDRMDESAANILIPVMESAMVLASHYAKACGRDTVTGKDVSYGLMYSVCNVTGRQIGSLFPEAYDQSDSEEEEDELEEVEETEEPFTRYEGEEEIFVSMNRCADTWESWEPTSPIERMLKDAVDKAKDSV